MANVLNRTTKQYLRSVNEPEYPLVDWIWNPDLSAVVGFPNSQYWIITGDVVTLMDQAARDVVDAARLEAQRDAIADAIDGIDSYDRAMVKVLIKEFNILRANDGLADRTIAQFKTAIRNDLDGT